MLCPKCGALIADDSLFCSKCGATIQNPPPEQQPPEQQPSEQQQPEQQPLPVQPAVPAVQMPPDSTTADTHASAGLSADEHLT